MSRRRKRKKQDSLQEEGGHKGEKAILPPTKPSSQTSRTTVRKPEAAPIEPVPVQPSRDIASKAKASVDDELEVELSDDFDENALPTKEKKISLPSGDSKTELRTLRRSERLSPSAKKTEEAEGRESTLEPQKRQKIRRTSDIPTSQEDEMGELDDTNDDIAPSPDEKSESLPSAQAQQKESSQVSDELTSASDTLEKISVRELAKNALGSLSTLEQAAIGMVVLILVVAAFWSSSVVLARIPNTVITSKLKYPLKGESVVIANFDSYWRSPIREGSKIDEGVSESIEIIPEVQVTLDSKSTARALRFLFRDEEGRYVGDSATVKISGAKFLPSEGVTAITKGSTAIVRSTTGFQHEGELISYLADDKFQWEVVILESKDGENYSEFMAIPISANRKDN